MKIDEAQSRLGPASADSGFSHQGVGDPATADPLLPEANPELASTPGDPVLGYLIKRSVRWAASLTILVYALLAGTLAGIGAPDTREVIFPIFLSPVFVAGLITSHMAASKTEEASHRIWAAQRVAMGFMIPAAAAFSLAGAYKSQLLVYVALIFAAGSGGFFIHQFVVAVKYYRGDNEGVLELLDFLTIVASALALVGYVLVVPVMIAGFERRIPYTLLPPVAVGFLVGILLLTASNKRNRRTAELVFAAAGGFALATGLLESLAALRGGDGGGPLWIRSSLWGVGLGLIAVAPLWAPIPSPAAPSRSSLTAWSAPRLFLPYWSLLALPLLAGLVIAGDREWAPAYALVSILIVLGVVVIRQLLTVGENQRLFSEVVRRDQDRDLLLARTIRAAEEERKRIARDLHDGPVQDLSALMLRMGRAAERSTSNPEILLNDLRDRLAMQVQAIRETIAVLRPPLLDKSGLASALENEVDIAFSRETTSVDFHAGISRELSSDQELQLFRIAQEAIRNTRMHARAEKVRVALDEDSTGAVILEIRDNGVGFVIGREAASTSRGHIGLASMHERAAIAGADFEILSTPGAGTIVRVRLPGGSK